MDELKKELISLVVGIVLATYFAAIMIPLKESVDAHAENGSLDRLKEKATPKTRRLIEGQEKAK